MFVYFNKEGVIKEIINDSSIRQGNSNVNTVYFFIEGADPQTATDSNGMYYKALFFSLGRYTMYLLDEQGEQLPSIEGESFDITTVKMEVPYDKKKELKYFKYFTRYEMFQLPIPQEVLNYKGTVGLKFQMINNDAINTQGLIVFNIEGTSPDLEIAPDTAITIAEWNYLLANMLTPEDVYTKSEANSTFQEKLIAGENITIEDNVISATGGGGPGGRAEWGSITGDIEDQTDLQTELSGKQNTLTFDNTPTDGSSNPVTSDGIYDAVQNVREVAEGKCKTFILSYATPTFPSNKEFYDEDGNSLGMGGSDAVNAYISNRQQANTLFNSNANAFQPVRYQGEVVPSYLLLTDNRIIHLPNDNIHKGDIFLVIETDVPDRWHGGDCVFYKLETSKVDLSGYVDLASAQNITGEKTFSIKQKFSNNGMQIGFGTLDYESAFRFDADIKPKTANAYSVGNSTTPWKDLYLSGEIKWSGTTNSNVLTTAYGYISIDGNSKLVLGQSNNEIRFYDSNIRIASPVLRPQADATTDLGNSSYQWKDLYLSGKTIFSAGTNTFSIGGNEYNGLDIARSGTTVMSFGGSDFSTYTHQPFSNNTYNLGSSSRAWQNLYLSQIAYSGNTTTAGENGIIFVNPDITNQGNWKIYSPTQRELAIQQIGQGDAVLHIARDQIYPNTTAYTSLGNNTYRWKTLFLSHYVDWGNGAILQKDSSNRINICNNSVPKVKVGANETYFANHVEPDTNNNFDLGRLGVNWRDLYLSRNLTDGTNSVSVAQIAQVVGGLVGTYRHVIYIEGSSADITIAVNLNSATAINTQAALPNINNYVMYGTATLDSQGSYKVVTIDSIATAGSIVYLDETGQHTLNIVDIYQDVITQL